MSRAIIVTFLALLLGAKCLQASVSRDALLFSPCDAIKAGTGPGAPVLDRDYDALGRLVKYTHAGDYTIEWIYHDPENSYSLKYPDGKQVRYDFDSRGRLAKVTDWAGRATTYEYDAVGRLEWVRRANRTRRHITYDDAGQIVLIREENRRGQAIAHIGYPAHWGNGQPRQEFSIPPRPAGIPAMNQAAMTYDDDNRAATWNGQTVIHDDDGNMTQGPLPPLAPGQSSPGMGSYGFDGRNRLLSCNGISYTYDAENLRVAVATGAGTTDWVLDPTSAPAARPLVRTKPDGSVTRYVWGLGLLYEEDDATGATRTYHYDRRGSTVALSAPDGLTVTDRIWYGAYGERLARTGTTDTPFQFNGAFGVQTDSNGLLHMGARYYNVELRRFVSADPMGFAESPNFYWFANGDPLSLADPFGLGAMDTNQGGNWFSQAAGGFFVDGAWGTGKGLWEAGTNPGRTAAGLWNAVTHPGQTLSAAWSGISGFVSNLASGEPRAIGQAGFELASSFIPIGKIKYADDIADIGRMATSLMDELVLDAAMQGKGIKIIDNLGDPKFKGMEKWSYSEKSAAGLR